MISSVILIVDDDPPIRESISKELRAAGYTTIAAADGAEGLRTFQTNAPDVVLTDLAMPRSDGFELIAAIRETSRVPVIVTLMHLLTEGSLGVMSDRENIAELESLEPMSTVPLEIICE